MRTGRDALDVLDEIVFRNLKREGVAFGVPRFQYGLPGQSCPIFLDIEQRG